MEYNLVPFYVAPYQQAIRYAYLPDERFDKEPGVYIYGQRTINLLQFTLTTTENTKVAHKSIVNYLQDEDDEWHIIGNDWVFYPSYESEYEDAYMSKNLLEEWDRVPEGDWYGTVQYWDHWLVGEQWTP